MGDQLRIVLGRDRALVGDKVTGTVFVDESIEACQRLEVALEYGGKKLGHAPASRATLHSGPLSKGLSFPFELEVPVDAPFTFAGHAHNVEWRAKASAEVPWAIDPKAEAELLVEPRPVATDAEIEAATRVPARPVTVAGPVLTYILSAILVIALVAAAPLLPVILILIARKHLIRTRVTDFTLEAPDRHFALGEWVPVTLRFRVKRAIDVERVTLTLKGTEQWSTGSGKSRTTHYHHFHEETLALLEKRIVAPAPGMGGRAGAGPYRSSGRSGTKGPVFVARTAVRLPPGGRPTVGGSVYYRLFARAALRGWPDPTAEKHVKTVGARLTAERVRPESPPIEESSGELAILGPGDDPPPGVDVRTAGAGVGGWIGLVVLGLTAAVGSGLVWLDSRMDAYLLVAIVGLLAMVGGVVGFFVRIYR
ncbi:MAG: hypothetical protein HYY06_30100 [Deltaproteobacteria bacterium]|nr:hypothetical protein [Deltaproteobacteria bacterium]